MLDAGMQWNPIPGLLAANKGNVAGIISQLSLAPFLAWLLAPAKLRRLLNLLPPLSFGCFVASRTVLEENVGLRSTLQMRPFSRRAAWGERRGRGELGQDRPAAGDLGSFPNRAFTKSVLGLDFEARNCQLDHHIVVSRPKQLESGTRGNRMDIGSGCRGS